MLAKDIGIPLEAGSRIIMQVHYNLLEGASPDTSSARLRLAPGTARLSPGDHAAAGSGRAAPAARK